TRLTDAIESLAEGFSLCGADDKLIVCNSRYRDLFASHADVMQPGTSFETIVRAAIDRGSIEDAAGRSDAWLQERLERHRNPDEPHVQHRSDGRWVRGGERKAARGGVVATDTDITELKQHEAELADLVEKLQVARDAADQANRTKSNFLANMSHELRTPLNAIIGYSEILQEDAVDKGNTAPIDDLLKIESAGRHLLGLINNILDLSKIEAGKMDVCTEEVDIRALIEEVLSIVKPLADKNENVDLRRRYRQLPFRPDQAQAVLAQSLEQRQQVHEQRHTDPDSGARGQCSDVLPRVGHGRRHDAGTPRPPVRSVQPGGCLDDQALRRHGTWARHHQALLHHAGRRRGGRELARQRLHVHHHASGSGPCGGPWAGARGGAGG